MMISDYGLQFIAGWEGLRNDLYDDGGPGKGNCTIGVGHLVHYDPCDGRAEEAPFKNGITDEQAYALMRTDVQRFESYVFKYITIPLNQNQFDALVDFSYNCGGGALAGIAPVVNAGGDVHEELLRFIHDGAGNVLKALQRRRDAEYRLYITPVVHGEEEEMKPFLVWDLDRTAWWFVGPWGAAWITTAADVTAIENVFGKGTLALHAASIDAIKAR